MRRTGRVGRAAALACAASLAAAACTGEDPAAAPSPTRPPASSATTTPAGPESTTAAPTTTSPAPTTAPGPVRPAGVDVVATGLTSPWGLAFLPDGSALVSERDTALVKRVTPAGRVSTVGEVPGVEPRGEGGLLGIAVSPGFATDGLVYAYLTSADDNRVVRMRWPAGGRLGRPEVVIDGIPNGPVHNGGRLAFGPDGMLYVSTGDSSDEGLSQDRGSLAGKVLRVRPDGRVPADNPYPQSPVFTYGHRNVQGLAFDADGRLWASEFGQNTYDELNLLRAGRNYGWPLAEGRSEEDGLVDPVEQWSTDDASPSGVAWLRDTIFMAALRGARLWVVPVTDGDAGRPRASLTGEYGRLRTVAAAPDGSLWVLTSNTDGRGDPRRGDDKVLRVIVRRAG